MQRWIILYAVLCLLLISLFPNPADADNHVRSLLEQHLSIVEAQRDLKQIESKEVGLQLQLSRLRVKLADQEAKLDRVKVHAGQVVKAYYTGDRTSLWMALFFSKTWKEFFLILDYVWMIYEQDRELFQTFSEQYKATKALEVDIQSKDTDYKQLKAQVQAQIRRLDQLQSDLDGKLAGRSDKEIIRKLMERLGQDWLNIGLPTFEQYFQTIAQSMQDLPNLITKDDLKQSESGYSLIITDSQINQFLQQKNPLLRSVTFTFKDGQMWIQGVQNDIALTIIGHYVLVSSKELQFAVDELTYDGYSLPKETIRQLSNQFDLGFYPTQIHPNVRLTEVEMKNHKLRLNINLSLLGG